MSDSRYKMSISLNILNHLGLNLYSNTPAVLAEVIANAWDADATEVKIDFKLEEKTITVSDNGHGMDIDDINDKYLFVGYQKRDKPDYRTLGGRRPMGRKGIGKLSLFSIANDIFVYSYKEGGEKESFLMDADKIKEAIKSEDPSSPKEYDPEPVDFDVDIPTSGTIIKITRLKKLRLTQASINGLRKRIARRFSIIDDPVGSFSIRINDSEVTFADRDYFHKARFLFQYGDLDYSLHCNNLDIDEDSDEKLFYNRGYRFDSNGNASEDGEHEISGWIAIARRSNDLDDTGQDDNEQDDNLNKITIVVRGKVAQEDILQEYRLGGMITKFIYGEIHADFLDEDDEQDIATSSRQRISEDDPRYRALKSFLDRELRHIWTETNKLKEKKGLDIALSSNPHIKEWYEELRPSALKKTAKKIFVDIDRSGVDEAHKQGLYANGILAFETLKMNNALEMLDTIDVSNLKLFLEYVSDIDSIEAVHYREIVQERLNVIKRLRYHVKKDVKEKVLQQYIFDHLWLLDPAWERATQYAEMEETVQAVVDDIMQKNEHYRIDIRYKRVMTSHVIVELKRASRRLHKTDLESQVRRYINAVRKKLNQMGDRITPLETICIVGKLPHGWDDTEERKRDEESLRPHSIRIITQDELIDNAFSAYSKFIEASESTGKLRELIKKIQEYKPA